jgi:hypothetical protein
MAEPNEIAAATEEVEALLNGFTGSVREQAQELVRVLMELYGAGLANILEIIRQSGDRGLLERLADDGLVASLLLVHGLHPVDTETRIRRALSRVGRFLEAHHLVFEGVFDGKAKVRVEAEDGTKNGHLPAALFSAIEQAVQQAAPDVDGVEVVGIPRPTALVQIGSAQER